MSDTVVFVLGGVQVLLIAWLLVSVWWDRRR